MGKKIAGVDLGGTRVKIAILTDEGEIIKKGSIETNSEEGPKNVFKRVADEIDNLLKAIDAPKKDLLCVGLGCPGPLDEKGDNLVFAPNLKGWVNVPIKKIVSEATGIPTSVNNDANAAAWGEYWKGLTEKVSSMVLFTLGTGIGGGIIIDGKLLRGHDNTAGEVGHIIVQPNGPLCGCGNFGCLEALASATAIARRVKETLHKDIVQTSLKNYPQEIAVQAKTVYDEAVKGDDFAMQILRENGYWLGIASANIISLLNPEVLLFSGGLSLAGDFIFKELVKTARANTFKASGERAIIRPAKLQEEAGVIGAAGLALVDLYQK